MVADIVESQSLLREPVQACWHTMVDNYAVYNDTKFLVDTVNKHFGCCGYDQYHELDWKNVYHEPRVVPDSCCRTITDYCGYFRNGELWYSRLHNTDCTQQLQEYTDNNLDYVFWIVGVYSCMVMFMFVRCTFTLGRIMWT